jgi:hypothetical protein
MGIQKLEGACNVGDRGSSCRAAGCCTILRACLGQAVGLEAVVFGGVLVKGGREARCHAFRSGGISFETTSARFSRSSA